MQKDIVPKKLATVKGTGVIGKMMVMDRSIIGLGQSRKKTYPDESRDVRASKSHATN